MLIKFSVPFETPQYLSLLLTTEKVLCSKEFYHNSLSSKKHDGREVSSVVSWIKSPPVTMMPIWVSMHIPAAPLHILFITTGLEKAKEGCCITWASAAHMETPLQLLDHTCSLALLQLHRHLGSEPGDARSLSCVSDSSLPCVTLPCETYLKQQQ